MLIRRRDGYDHSYWSKRKLTNQINRFWEFRFSYWLNFKPSPLNFKPSILLNCHRTHLKTRTQGIRLNKNSWLFYTIKNLTTLTPIIIIWVFVTTELISIFIRAVKGWHQEWCLERDFPDFRKFKEKWVFQQNLVNPWLRTLQSSR